MDIILIVYLHMKFSELDCVFRTAYLEHCVPLNVHLELSMCISHLVYVTTFNAHLTMHIHAHVCAHIHVICMQDLAQPAELPRWLSWKEHPLES